MLIDLILGVACDLGNQKLISDLAVCEEKPWFSPIASSTRRIYFFPDVPHLLKLLRNHLLDSGLRLADGTVIQRLIFKVLFNDLKDLL
jgi:hypothetical protein